MIIWRENTSDSPHCQAEDPEDNSIQDIESMNIPILSFLSESVFMSGL